MQVVSICPGKLPLSTPFRNGIFFATIALQVVFSCEVLMIVEEFVVVQVQI